MVASRFAIFSLSSEGLMTTAFPAEHAESGPCPPSDHAGSPSVLCVLGGTDSRAEGRRPQKRHHPPSAEFRCGRRGKRREGRAWALMGEQSWSQPVGLVSPDASKLRATQRAERGGPRSLLSQAGLQTPGGPAKEFAP